jgi:PEP-CTERM motif
MSRRMMRFVVVFFAATCGTVSAEPISYSEVMSGDLGELPSSTVFSLGIGMNTFSGRLGAGPGFGDFDSIAFSVPTGAVLTGISYSIVSTLFPETLSAGSSFFLVAGNVPPDPSLGRLDVSANFPGGLAESTAFSGVLPLSPGVYGLSHSGMGFSTSNPTGRSGFFQDYTWKFTMQSDQAPVPEPTTALLLATGALAISRRVWLRRALS